MRYEIARGSYGGERRAAADLAAERDAEASRAVLDLATSLEASTGYPIQIVFEDLPPEADAYVEVAPLARRDCHVVHCTPFLSRPIYLHMLAHELTHNR